MSLRHLILDVINRATERVGLTTIAAGGARRYFVTRIRDCSFSFAAPESIDWVAKGIACAR